jgi:hypothetical protein
MPFHSLMAVLHPSLAIVATTKGIVDQTALELDWYCCPPLEGQSMLKRFLAGFFKIKNKKV